MTYLLVNKELLDYSREDNVVTAQYLIKLVNNSDKFIREVSVKELISGYFPNIKVLVESNTMTLKPYKCEEFQLPNDGQILNVCKSFIRPNTCAHLCVTITFVLEDEPSTCIEPIKNCVLVDGKISVTCKNHDGKCKKCKDDKCKCETKYEPKCCKTKCKSLPQIKECADGLIIVDFTVRDICARNIKAENVTAEKVTTDDLCANCGQIKNLYADNLEVADSTTFNGEVCANDLVTLKDDLNLEGDLKVDGDVCLNKDECGKTKIKGTLCVDKIESNKLQLNGDFCVNGETKMNDKLDVCDDLKITGISELCGKVNIRNNLCVFGDTILQDICVDNLKVTELIETTDLLVNGCTELNKLGVTGTAIFNGPTVFNDTTKTQGLVVCNGLTVQGVSLFNGDGAFNGKVAAQELISQGDLIVGATATFNGPGIFNDTVKTQDLTVCGNITRPDGNKLFLNVDNNDLVLNPIGTGSKVDANVKDVVNANTFARTVQERVISTGDTGLQPEDIIANAIITVTTMNANLTFPSAADVIAYLGGSANTFNTIAYDFYIIAVGVNATVISGAGIAITGSTSISSGSSGHFLFRIDDKDAPGCTVYRVS